MRPIMAVIVLFCGTGMVCAVAPAVEAFLSTLFLWVFIAAGGAALAAGVWHGVASWRR